MFQVMATHHAAPAHRDAFIAFMQRVIDVTSGAEGLLEFTGWAEANGTRLFGLSRWESPAHFEAGLARIQSLAADRRPEWSVAEDEVVMFELVAGALPKGV